MERIPLVFWREVPVDVDKTTYEYISANWGMDVYFYYFSDFDNDRKKLGYTHEGEYNEQVLKDKQELINIVKARKSAIHIVGGFRQNMHSVLWTLKQYNVNKIVVLCERPTQSASGLKKILYKIYAQIYYGLMSLMYSYMLAAFFAMGGEGVESYVRCGWPKNKLFPYMYCTGDVGVSAKALDKKTLRLVYIGRFDEKNKGVATLISAVQELPSDLPISLDFVGGYGDLVNDVKAFAEKDSRIRYIGKWNPADVVENLTNYDVCIVPSKYDGWNLSANHSINAGIGCVISNNATSDELVKHAGNGQIICSDKISIQKSIIWMTEHRNDVEKWKINAQKFQNRISSKSVGDYFISVLDYILKDETGIRPVAPWLEE